MQSSQIRNVGLSSSAETKRDVPAWTQDPKIFPLDWFSLSRPNIITQTKEYVSELSKWRNCPKIKTLSKLKAVLKRIMMFLHTHTSYIDKKSLLECDLEDDLITLVSLYMDMELRVLLIKKTTASEADTRNDQLVTDRLSYWLYTVLKAHEQRVDALLSTSVYSRHTRPVLDPIFRKILSEMPDGSLGSVNYVRHMLAYKTWRERILVTNDDITSELCTLVEQRLMSTESQSFRMPLRRCLGPGTTTKDYARPHNVNLPDACRHFMRYCREIPAAADNINFAGIPLLDDDLLGDEESEVHKLMTMISDRKQRKIASSPPQTTSMQVDAFIDLTEPLVNASIVIDLTEDDEKPVIPPDNSLNMRPPPDCSYSRTPAAVPVPVEAHCFRSFSDNDIYLVNISCICPMRHRRKCQCQENSNWKDNKALKKTTSERNCATDNKYQQGCFQFAFKQYNYPNENPEPVATTSQNSVKLERRPTTTCNVSDHESHENEFCDSLFSNNITHCDCDGCKRQDFENRTCSRGASVTELSERKASRLTDLFQPQPSTSYTDNNATLLEHQPDTLDKRKMSSSLNESNLNCNFVQEIRKIKLPAIINDKSTNNNLAKSPREEIEQLCSEIIELNNTDRDTLTDDPLIQTDFMEKSHLLESIVPEVSESSSRTCPIEADLTFTPTETNNNLRHSTQDLDKINNKDVCNNTDTVKEFAVNYDKNIEESTILEQQQIQIKQIETEDITNIENSINRLSFNDKSPDLYEEIIETEKVIQLADENIISNSDILKDLSKDTASKPEEMMVKDTEVNEIEHLEENLNRDKSQEELDYIKNLNTVESFSVSLKETINLENSKISVDIKEIENVDKSPITSDSEHVCDCIIVFNANNYLDEKIDKINKVSLTSEPDTDHELNVQENLEIPFIKINEISTLTDSLKSTDHIEKSSLIESNENLAINSVEPSKEYIAESLLLDNEEIITDSFNKNEEYIDETTLLESEDVVTKPVPLPEENDVLKPEEVVTVDTLQSSEKNLTDSLKISEEQVSKIIIPTDSEQLSEENVSTDSVQLFEEHVHEVIVPADSEQISEEHIEKIVPTDSVELSEVHVSEIIVPADTEPEQLSAEHIPKKIVPADLVEISEIDVPEIIIPADSEQVSEEHIPEKIEPTESVELSEEQVPIKMMSTDSEQLSEKIVPADSKQLSKEHISEEIVPTDSVQLPEEHVLETEEISEEYIPLITEEIVTEDLLQPSEECITLKTGEIVTEDLLQSEGHVLKSEKNVSVPSDKLMPLESEKSAPISSTQLSEEHVVEAGEIVETEPLQLSEEHLVETGEIVKTDQLQLSEEHVVETGEIVETDSLHFSEEHVVKTGEIVETDSLHFSEEHVVKTGEIVETDPLHVVETGEIVETDSLQLSEEHVVETGEIVETDSLQLSEEHVVETGEIVEIDSLQLSEEHVVETGEIVETDPLQLSEEHVVETGEIVETDPLQLSEDTMETDPLQLSEEIVATDSLKTSEEIVETDPLQLSEEIVATDSLKTSEDIMTSDSLKTLEEIVETEPLKTSEDSMASDSLQLSEEIVETDPLQLSEEHVVETEEIVETDPLQLSEEIVTADPLQLSEEIVETDPLQLSEDIMASNSLQSSRETVAVDSLQSSRETVTVDSLQSSGEIVVSDLLQPSKKIVTDPLQSFEEIVETDPLQSSEEIVETDPLQSSEEIVETDPLQSSEEIEIYNNESEFPTSETSVTVETNIEKENHEEKVDAVDTSVVTENVSFLSENSNDRIDKNDTTLNKVSKEYVEKENQNKDSLIYLDDVKELKNIQSDKTFTNSEEVLENISEEPSIKSNCQPEETITIKNSHLHDENINELSINLKPEHLNQIEGKETTIESCNLSQTIIEKSNHEVWPSNSSQLHIEELVIESEVIIDSSADHEANIKIEENKQHSETFTKPITEKKPNKIKEKSNVANKIEENKSEQSKASVNTRKGRKRRNEMEELIDSNSEICNNVLAVGNTKRRRKQNLRSVKDDEILQKKDKELKIVCRKLSKSEIDTLLQTKTKEKSENIRLTKTQDKKKSRDTKLNNTGTNDNIKLTDISQNNLDQSKLKSRLRGRPPKQIANKLKFFSENFNLQNLESRNSQNDIIENNFEAEEDIPLAFRKRNSTHSDSSQDDQPLTKRKLKTKGKVSSKKSIRQSLEQFKCKPKRKTENNDISNITIPDIPETSKQVSENKSKRSVKTYSKTKNLKNNLNQNELKHLKESEQVKTEIKSPLPRAEQIKIKKYREIPEVEIPKIVQTDVPVVNKIDFQPMIYKKLKKPSKSSIDLDFERFLPKKDEPVEKFIPKKMLSKKAREKLNQLKSNENDEPEHQTKIDDTSESQIEKPNFEPIETEVITTITPTDHSKFIDFPEAENLQKNSNTNNDTVLIPTETDISLDLSNKKSERKDENEGVVEKVHVFNEELKEQNNPTENIKYGDIKYDTFSWPNETPKVFEPFQKREQIEQINGNMDNKTYEKQFEMDIDQDDVSNSGLIIDTSAESSEAEVEDSEVKEIIIENMEVAQEIEVSIQLTKDKNEEKKRILEEKFAEIHTIEEGETEELIIEPLHKERIFYKSVEMSVSLDIGLECCTVDQKTQKFEHAKMSFVKCSVNGKHKNNKRVVIRGTQNKFEECINIKKNPIEYCRAEEIIEPERLSAEVTAVEIIEPDRLLTKVTPANVFMNDKPVPDNSNLFILADIAAKSGHLNTKTQSVMEIKSGNATQIQNQPSLDKNERCILVTFPEKITDYNKPSSNVSIVNNQNEEIMFNVQKIAGGLEPKGIRLENKIQTLTERAKHNTRSPRDNLDELYSSLENICEFEMSKINKNTQKDEPQTASASFQVEQPKITEPDIPIDIPNTALLHLIPDYDDFIMIQSAEKQEPIFNKPIVNDPPKVDLPPPKVDLPSPSIDIDSGVVKNLYNIIDSLEIPPKAPEPKSKSRKAKKIPKSSTDTSYLLNKYKSNCDSLNKNTDAQSSTSNSPPSYIRTTRPMRMVTTKKRDIQTTESVEEPTEKPVKSSKQVSDSEKIFDKLLEEHRKEMSEGKLKHNSTETSNENESINNEEQNIPLTVLEHQSQEINSLTFTSNQCEHGRVNNKIENPIEQLIENKMEESVTENEKIVEEEKQQMVEDDKQVIEEMQVIVNDKNIIEEKQVIEDNKHIIEEKQQAIEDDKQIIEEKQVIKDDKQLIEVKQQVLEVDKQIIEETQPIIEVGEQIIEGNQQSAEDGKQIIAEKQIAEEGKQIAEEGKQIAEEGKQIVEEGKQIIEEEKQIIEEGKQIIEEEKQIVEEEKQVIEEGKQIVKEIKQIVEEKQGVGGEKQIVEEEKQIDGEAKQSDGEKKQITVQEKKIVAEMKEEEKDNKKTETAIEVVQNWFNRVDDKEQEPYSQIATYQTIEECNFFEEISNSSENSPNVAKTEEKVFSEHQTPDSGIAFDEDSVQKEKLQDSQNISDNETFYQAEPIKTYFCNVSTPSKTITEKIQITDVRIIKPIQATGNNNKIKVSIALERIKDIIPFLTKQKMLSPERKKRKETDLEPSKNKKRKYSTEEIPNDFFGHNQKDKHKKRKVVIDCPNTKDVKEIVSPTPNQKNFGVRTKGSVKEYPDPDYLFGITESPVPSGSFHSPYPSDISLTEEPIFYEESIDHCNDYPVYDSFEILQAQQSQQSLIQKEAYVVDDNPKDVQQGLQAGYSVVDSQYLHFSGDMNDGDFIDIIFDDKRMLPVNMHQVQPETKPHNTEETKRSEFDDSEKEDSLSETVEEIIKNPELFPEQSTSEIQVINMDQATSEVQLVIGCDSLQDTEMSDDTFMYGIPLQTEQNIGTTVTPSTSITNSQPEVVEEVEISNNQVIENLVDTQPETPIVSYDNSQFNNSDIIPVTETQPTTMKLLAEETQTKHTTHSFDNLTTSDKIKTNKIIKKGLPEIVVNQIHMPEPKIQRNAEIITPKPSTEIVTGIKKRTINSVDKIEEKISRTDRQSYVKINDCAYKDRKYYKYPSSAYKPHSKTNDFVQMPAKSETKTYQRVPDAFDRLKQESSQESQESRNRHYNRYHRTESDNKRYAPYPEKHRSYQVSRDSRRSHSAYTEPSPKPTYRMPSSDPSYRNFHPTNYKVSEKKPEFRSSGSKNGQANSNDDWYNNKKLLSVLESSKPLFKKY